MAQTTYSQVSYEKHFSHCELIKGADDKPITIETGTCCPYFYDFNSDGINDLIIGEFGNIRCGVKDARIKKGFVEGRGRVFINSKKDGYSFNEYYWLKDGDKPLYIPNT